MPRYVAFLRGVSPMNAKMADLKEWFEKIGFTDVRTILSSGNVVFTGVKKQESNLAKVIESGMEKYLPRSFPVIVRTTNHLLALLKTDPYSDFHISPEAKRVVTFLSQPHKENLLLPIELDGAKILAMDGAEVFTAYVPHECGPIFMTLIEKTLGKNVTTRTWDTIKKCAAARGWSLTIHPSRSRILASSISAVAAVVSAHYCHVASRLNSSVRVLFNSFRRLGEMHDHQR